MTEMVPIRHNLDVNANLAASDPSLAAPKNKAGLSKKINHEHEYFN